METAVASDDLAALVEAQSDWESAAADYASTPEGNRHLRDQSEAAERDGDFDTMALLNTVIVKGEAMRAANRDAAAFLRAARLAQAEPSIADATTGGYSPYETPRVGELVLPDLATVPGLSATDRAHWEQCMTETQALMTEVHRVPVGNSRVSGDEFVQDLAKIDRTIGDGATSDEVLANMVFLAGKHDSVLFVAMPQWADDAAAGVADARMDTDKRRGLERRWSALARGLRHGLSAQAERALGHPNAGMATFRQYAAEFPHEKRAATAHGNAPQQFVLEVAQNSPTKVADEGWSRLREARFENNTVAMVLAANDPDSFHRGEAFNQVTSMGMDTITEKDRAWLARNLAKMPASAETQRIVAGSLRSWAQGYADTAERKKLEALLSSSTVAPVAEVGRSLLGAPVEVPVRKRLFGRD